MTSSGRLEVLDQPEHREEVADLVGQIGVARDIFFERGTLAAPAALQELFGEVLYRRLSGEETVMVAFSVWSSSGRALRSAPRSKKPGMFSRMAWSRMRPGRTACWPRDLQAEDLGRLGVAQLLEMPQGDDLAVDLVHAVEGGLELELALGPETAWLAVVYRPRSWAASETELACGRRLVQRDLAAGIAHGGAQVLTVDPHQPLPGHQPQPEEERHLALVQVAGSCLATSR